MIKKTITVLSLSIFSLTLSAQQKENTYTGPKINTSEMDQKVNALLDKMTIEEKIGQLNLLTPGGGVATGAVVSDNVQQKIKDGKVGGLFGVSGPEKIRIAQEYAVNDTRLGIPLLIGSDVIHGYKTTFPIPLASASSWDMELLKKTAQVAAKEATADGINWNFSPMVDVSRDPRWGRVAEGAGENLFIVKDERLYEPELTSALIGITRDTVIKLAEEIGITVEQYCKEVYKQLVDDTNEKFLKYSFKQIDWEDSRVFYGEYHTEIEATEYLSYSLFSTRAK